MKTRSQLLIASAFIGLLLSTAGHAARQNLEGIAAVVDQEIILQSDFDTEYNRIRQRLLLEGTRLPPESILRKQVMEHMIVKEIQLINAARLGIRVDDNMLNDHIQRIAAQNRISMIQLKQEVEAEGSSYAEYRAMIRKDLIMQQLRQRAVYERVYVSDQEIEDYLAQNPIGSEQLEYKLSHILLGVPEEASPEDVQAAQAKAKQLYQELKNGANFSEIAIANSNGQRALEGGDLGWFKRPQVPTLFAKAIDKIQKGQIAKPIRSPSGFHIIKLDDERGEDRRVVRQAHVRHILIKPDVITNMEQARQKIAKLRKRIEQGEDFAVLAKAHSADGSAAQGGDLGWADPAQYVPTFQKAVDSLPLNTLSEPIRTQFGWHILEVMGHRDYDETDDYRRNIARRNLRELKAGEEEELWLRRIRDQAYVEFRMPGLANDSKTAQ